MPRLLLSFVLERTSQNRVTRPATPSYPFSDRSQVSDPPVGPPSAQRNVGAALERIVPERGHGSEDYGMLRVRYPRGMELYVMRHGPAEDEAAADDIRELTPKGRDCVRSVARELVRHRETPRVILTSPLVRAAQTAGIVAAETSPPDGVEVRAELGMNEGAMDLVRELISSEKSHVMLVGHQPDLSTLVHGLTRVSLDMEKGMVVGITVPKEGRPHLRFVLHPKTLVFAATLAGAD
jgi:phosphohistidine phosphatase